MQSIISDFNERYSVHSSSPDLFQLKRIANAFSHLPYENVTKILKEARSTGVSEKLRKTEEVLSDHLRWSTGGTCFSLCNTLHSILKNSGFHNFIAMADMNYGKNIHCAVVVSLPEGEFLVDPGYLLHQPLRLPDMFSEQSCKTSMNTVVLQSEGENVYSLFTIESGQRKWRYRLRAVEVSEEEFETHWVHSFSLNTMENVMMSRLDNGSRLFFRKDHLERVGAAQRIKVTNVESKDLSRLFGVPADLILQARNVVIGRPRNPGGLIS